MTSREPRALEEFGRMLIGALLHPNEEKMSGAVPTFADWYPDAYTGGTKYWDGSRWTGDTRPRRRPFAAPAANRENGFWVIGVGGLSLVVIFGGVFGDKSMPLTALLFVPLIVLVFPAVGAYILRGQGPTTQAVEARLSGERKAADTKRKAANRWGFAASLGRVVQPLTPAAPTSNDAATAAQINAIASPETAQALQNLHNLLYTQAITDHEYQAAKDKLLGTQAAPDSFAKITQLAELHRAGVLSDLEFANAKARALGL